MALPLDAVDLLCGRSNLPADVFSGFSTSPMAYPGPYMQGCHPNHSPFAQPVSPLMPFPTPASAGAPGLALPLGLDASLPQALPLPQAMPPSHAPAGSIHVWALEAKIKVEQAEAIAACSKAGPIHAWALEAKILAEQKQARQQQWAEKEQLRYIQGQNLLKALQVDERPKDVPSNGVDTTDSAFDRLVMQMGLKNETPRSKGQKDELAIGQTPPSKHQAPDWGTPPMVTKSRRGRRTSDNHDLTSPTAPKGAKVETSHGTVGGRRWGGR